MADVMANRGRRTADGDRGQLILVTGLAVAVTLVALVLLLNTAIYTQNLATRGASADDGAAVAYRQEVLAGVGGVVDAENRAEYVDSERVVRNVTEAIRRYDGLATRYAAERGTVADIEDGTVTPAGVTNGTLLRQTNASRNFTTPNGQRTQWTLVEDVTRAGNAAGLRRFRLTVSRENLTDSGSPAGFSVRLAGDGGAVWRAYVYDDGGITVAVKDGGEASATEVCSAAGPEATVDLTAGTVDGTDCSGLDYAAGIDAPYDLQFRGADEATGTYEVTVRTPEGAADPTVQSGAFAGPDDAASPRAVPAVYAARFEVHFQTPELVFHTTVRVARGEPE